MPTQEEIKTEIRQFIEEKGGRILDWYVGISSAPEERLFQEHGLIKNNDDWIYRTAESQDEAKRIGKYFAVMIRTDGAGYGELNASTVYAYRKKPHTKP